MPAEVRMNRVVGVVPKECRGRIVFQDHHIQYQPVVMFVMRVKPRRAASRHTLLTHKSLRFLHSANETMDETSCLA